MMMITQNEILQNATLYTNIWPGRLKTRERVGESEWDRKEERKRLSNQQQSIHNDDDDDDKVYDDNDVDHNNEWIRPNERARSRKQCGKTNEKKEIHSHAHT